MLIMVTSFYNRNGSVSNTFLIRAKCFYDASLELIHGPYNADRMYFNKRGNIAKNYDFTYKFERVTQ